MIQEAQEIAGQGAADALRRERDMIRRLSGGSSAPPASQWRDASDLDRDENGELLIHRENLPVVATWLQVNDQWIREGMEGRPVAMDMGVVLQYAQQVAAMAPDEEVQVLEVTAGVRVVAFHVLQHLQSVNTKGA